MHRSKHTSNALTFAVENVQWQGLVSLESNNIVRLNNCMDSGRNSDTLHATHGQVEGDREEIEISWHRMKWTHEMVKLLITAVAYIGEYVNLSHQNKNQKKGKWRAISSAMIERGYHVSPQQCEDKFNDVKKKYKRLNDILGKSTAYDVVENPAVMDSMNLSDETAEEVIKILSSKQLFYQEMCSYYNGNWLLLPDDQDLQRSLYLALKGHKGESQQPSCEKSAKRMREGEVHGEIVVLENGLNSNEKNNSRCVSTVGGKGEKLLNQRWITNRLQELEEQKFKIEGQRLELEKKRLKWLRYCQREDWKVEKMSLENKILKLENHRFAFELKNHKKGSK